MVGILTLQMSSASLPGIRRYSSKPRGLSHCSPRSRVVGSPRIASVAPLLGARREGSVRESWPHFREGPRRGIHLRGHCSEAAPHSEQPGA